MVQKGTWVRIKKILLPVGQRAPQDPEDTRNTPLVMWTKGFLAADANLGDEVQVTTAADRVETGTLVEVDPYYTHSYGKCVPELVQIDRNYRAFLYGGDGTGKGLRLRDEPQGRNYEEGPGHGFLRL